MQCHDAWSANDALKINEICNICIRVAYAMTHVKWCMHAMYERVQMFYCSIVWTRENKSLIIVGDEECKYSNFFEVEMLGDGFSLLEK